jgi:hypothetical protein
MVVGHFSYEGPDGLSFEKKKKKKKKKVITADGIKAINSRIG